MTLERNTYVTSAYIAAPQRDVTTYLANGMNLNEYTLFSRMEEQIDDTTWRGTASGYQAGLYYHMVRRDLGPIQIAEWHCGAELGVYHHVYPMLTIAPSYLGSAEAGTYFQWISFVDPARTTAMITQGLPSVHRSEARSMKAQLERRHGHRRAVHGQLLVAAHTIYVDAPAGEVARYLAEPANLTEWSYLIRRTADGLVDEYDHPIDVQLRHRDLGAYQVIEHDTHHLDHGDAVDACVRAPLLVIPAAYAFGQPAARGVILHRLSAWPATGERRLGKASVDDYDTELINTKRFVEARIDNRSAYARGCSYLSQ